MPDPTIWGQLTGYTGAGKELYHELKGVLCLPGPEFVGAAAVGYTVPGLDLLAWAWECCDGICPDSEEDCYVEEDCFTGGISKRLAFRLVDFHTCFTARGKKGLLEWNGSDWYGEVEMRGGTLGITFSCEAGADSDPAKFKLTFGRVPATPDSGCAGGSVSAGYTCADPLIVAFDQIAMPICCDCPESPASPYTEETARVTIIVTGNCRNTVLGTLISYTPGGKELYGYPEPCDYRQPAETQDCGDMLCGIMAEVDTTGDCDCFNGVYPVNYLIGPNQWVNEAPGWSCLGGVASLAVVCTDLGNDNLRITVNVVCGVTAGGTGFADIPAGDLEDLEVIENVSIDNSADPSECCSGSVPFRIYRP
jgi:hypothetical protein